MIESAAVMRLQLAGPALLVLLSVPGRAQTPRGPEAPRARTVPSLESALAEAGGLARDSVLAADAARADEVRRLAEEWTRAGADFSGVFRLLCARSLASPETVSLRDLFAGLKDWMSRGARPELQERYDWALHFVYAGWLSSSVGEFPARAAAFHKEVRDSMARDNSFDLDDLAVSYMGARWAARAASDRGVLNAWAEGSRSLNAIAALAFGQLPRGRQADGRQLRAVGRWVDEATR